jgi:hypothetical protein
VEFYSSTWINLFHSIFFFFFHLEETLYRFIGDSLRCMPANVIEFMFLASLDCVLLFNLYILPWQTLDLVFRSDLALLFSHSETYCKRNVFFCVILLR